MNLPKENSSELLTVLIQNYSLPYDIEFSLFCAINPAFPLVESIAEDEILKVETYENTILILNRLKTDKLLLIAPRNMLFIRAVKKIGDETYIDVVQSVNVNVLIENKKVKEIYESIQENFSTNFVTGILYENKDGVCKVSSYSKADFRSSVKLMFMKIFVTKGFEKSVKNTLLNCKTILEQAPWKNKEKDLIWFTNSKTGICKPKFFKDDKFAKSQVVETVEQNEREKEIENKDRQSNNENEKKNTKTNSLLDENEGAKEC